MALAALDADDAQRAFVLDDVELVALAQPVQFAQGCGDRDLALAVETHGLSSDANPTADPGDLRLVHRSAGRARPADDVRARSVLRARHRHPSNMRDMIYCTA